MNPETIPENLENSITLQRELQWFEEVLSRCMEVYFQRTENASVPFTAGMPDLENDGSAYAGWLRQHGPGYAERLVICLALAPHLKPQALDIFLTANPLFEQPFTEFGGYRQNGQSGFLPTGETAAFILAQDQLPERFEVMKLFAPEHLFAREDILHLHQSDPMASALSGRLLLSASFLRLLSGGQDWSRELEENFPAKKITTLLEWDDLIVAPFVLDELSQIRSWIVHEARLMQDPVFRKHIKPGYRSLFYGPPGTGKTMAAGLLGKSCGLDVYRIDLSLVVSKYIGETEKNLSRVFDYAEKRNWILFFDEADALFGKRTQTNSSNDRFANQEVAYLLQKVEDFPGVIILASNLKSNMDEAFSRRFQSTVYFPMPDRQQRLQLWQSLFSGGMAPDEHFDLEALARDYELSGGSMINVLRYAVLKTVQRGDRQLMQAEIIDGIRKEFQKYGKTL